MTTNDTSPRAGLDLDAVEARIAACVRPCAWEDSDGCRDAATQKCAGGNCGLRLCDAHAEMHGSEMLHDTYPLPRNAVPEARALLAETRRLLTLRDDLADAFDGLVLKVWRAAGEEHGPPADVEALLARVADDHKALVGFRRAMLDVHEALDGVRPGPDFDMPAELGSYACDEVARLQESRDALRAEVRQLRAAALHRRREGAEAMREACAAEADHFAGESVAAYIRALPLPEGEP